MFNKALSEFSGVFVSYANSFADLLNPNLYEVYSHSLLKVT